MAPPVAQGRAVWLPIRRSDLVELRPVGSLFHDWAMVGQESMPFR